MKPINGYTKKEIIWYLKTFNNGTRSGDDTDCYYKLGNNHCAVGCFIPHDHEGLEERGDVIDLLSEFPKLKEYMPLPKKGLQQLQYIHDFSGRESYDTEIPIKYQNIANVRKRMIAWVKDNVE